MFSFNKFEFNKINQFNPNKINSHIHNIKPTEVKFSIQQPKLASKPVEIFSQMKSQEKIINNYPENVQSYSATRHVNQATRKIPPSNPWKMFKKVKSGGCGSCGRR